MSEEIRRFIEDGMNKELNVIKAPKGILEGVEVRRRVKIYIVEEGLEVEQIEASLNLDENMMPSLKIKENRMEIGFGEYRKSVGGDIYLTFTLIGSYAVETQNVPGFAQMKGMIPRELRKD